MTNSIKYLFYNSEKNERRVEVDGASLCFGGSGALRWVVAACLLLQTTRHTNTARPAYYDTIHRRTTINVL